MENAQLIDRPLYTKSIIPFIDKGIIKVLTGQRRVGKSCIMLQMQELIKRRDQKANVVYINMEYEGYRNIRNNTDLSDYLKDKFTQRDANYLFIDEVQEIVGFENTLRSLQAQNSCDIFITGSNAMMLSSELSTYLSGRYMEFHIHSLSYLEFLEFHQLNDSDESLVLYLTYGGMPHLAQFPLSDNIVFEYLKNVYSTILLKDVIKREKIRNVAFLETLALYAADNVGNLFSATNISKYLKSQRVNINTTQVISYLKSLCDAFLINRVRRMDINGLKMFEIGEKFYFEDLGLRNCQLGFDFQRDVHKLIENAVYLHLKRNKYDVYIGQLKDLEIDFVGKKEGVYIYVQTAFLLTEEATQQREFGNLQQIQDNYPKYVVSMNPYNYTVGDYKGIIHVHLRDFLKLKL